MYAIIDYRNGLFKICDLLWLTLTYEWHFVSLEPMLFALSCKAFSKFNYHCFLLFASPVSRDTGLKYDDSLPSKLMDKSNRISLVQFTMIYLWDGDKHMWITNVFIRTKKPMQLLDGNVWTYFIRMLIEKILRPSTRWGLHVLRMHLVHPTPPHPSLSFNQCQARNDNLSLYFYSSILIFVGCISVIVVNTLIHLNDDSHFKIIVLNFCVKARGLPLHVHWDLLVGIFLTMIRSNPQLLLSATIVSTRLFHAIWRH